MINRRQILRSCLRGSGLVLLGGIVMQLRRPLKWDFKTETFPGDDEANKMLDRPRRDPWQLPNL